MPIYTVVGLREGKELFVASVFSGKLRNADRERETDLYGMPMERFLGYFAADSPAQAEQMAVESVAWHYPDPDEPSFDRHVTTIKIRGEVL